MKKKGIQAALVIGILVGMLVSGCGLLPGTGADLDGTSWTLESYAGDELIPGTSMTAIFEGREISGSASCNHYFGSYQIQGTGIEIEGLAWTEMACLDPEGIMTQEQEIMHLLGSASAYQLGGNRLIITAENGSQLIFSSQQAK